MWGVPGICDRCGQRYTLKELRPEYVLGRNTGLRVCSSCWDESHPQLDTRGVKTNDKQSVNDSRSDTAELNSSRAIFSFNPVGHESTGSVSISVGRVTVSIT